MVLCTADPSVVGELVVVPAGDHRIGLVQALQVGIEAVAGVAQPIVGERYGLVRRVERARGMRLGRIRVDAGRVLVEIVTHMHHQVEVAALAGVRVGVEPAEAEVGAGEETDAEARHLALRERARAADRAHRAIGGDEAVEVPAPGREALHHDARGVVAVRVRVGFAAGDDTREHRVGRDLDAQARAGLRGVARPQQHAARPRLAARHAVREAAGVQDGGDARQGDRAETVEAGFDETAAVDVHGSSVRCSAAVSGRTPRQRRKDSAACSISMPRPCSARMTPCARAQRTNGVSPAP